MYAIIDIETTGGRALRDKITEIAIVLHDGNTIIDQYETLLNPECSIPYNITKLTGITQEMVRYAPKFHQVARKVIELTEGAIFVAHNVNFDYGFIREEFRRLGYNYYRQKLCTVRLSRRVFPGLRSYSLGNLIRHFNIKVNDRHRAMADTLATVELFEKALAVQTGKSNMVELVNLGVREELLPTSITLKDIQAIPEKCGVYYFYNSAGEVIYIGKGKNIRKQVAKHFSKATTKTLKLQKYAQDISYEIMGSELAAALFEKQEIKHLRPSLNRVTKQRKFPFVIHYCKNEHGFICFQIDKPKATLRKKLQVINSYPKQHQAVIQLRKIQRQFNLCNRLCQLEQRSQEACLNFSIKKCKGACVQQENPQLYNERAKQGIEQLKIVFEQDFFLLDVGRTREERAVIWITEQTYKGFGYINNTEARRVEDLQDAIREYESDEDSLQIIRRFMYENPRLKKIPITQRKELTIN